MTRQSWLPRVAMLSAVCWVLASGTARGQRTLTIERFDAAIAVLDTGAIEVTETIRVRFGGAWNGIYRTIPVEYRTPEGFNYTLELAVISIADESGRALEYESSRERHYRRLQIWVPAAVDATRTVIVRYQVENGLRFFEEHDELYWNVTGDEWQAVIESADARVRLPAGVTGVRATAFTGVYGSRESAATVTIGPADVAVESTESLDFREGLTVVIGWDPGVVSRPSGFTRAWRFLRANVVLMIPLLVCPVMWRVWYLFGRDPRRRPAAVQYGPPPELTPAEVGTLVDNSPDMRDITATLVDLAVRGLIVIEQVEEDRFFGLFSKTDYRLLLTKPRSDWPPLKDFEERLLSGLFSEAEAVVAAGGGRGEETVCDSVTLSSLKNKFYKNLPGIKTALFDELLHRQHYLRRPDRMRVGFLVGAVVAAVGVNAMGELVNGWFGIESNAPWVSGLLTGLIVAAFGWVMPARTVKGARTLEQVLGFEEFLRRVEEDRFARTIKTPELFEKYLPFAMALGVESNWARAFDDMAMTPPRWYRGDSTAGFRPGSFSSSLSRMSAAAATSLASSPRSSGGSGFGGGSSGGGFGGGGGGGF